LRLIVLRSAQRELLQQQCAELQREIAAAAPSTAPDATAAMRFFTEQKTELAIVQEQLSLLDKWLAGSDTIAPLAIVEERLAQANAQKKTPPGKHKRRSSRKQSLPTKLLPPC